MIAAFLKKTFPLDLENPLTQYLKSHYGKSKTEAVSLKLKEINQLRKDCMVEDKTANPTVDIPKYTRYYEMLCILERRFAFGKSNSGWFSKVQAVMVEFRWCDAYVPKKIITSHSIKVEKVSILYNLAALMSLQAVKRQSGGEEGLKEAVALFRDSAGAFKHLAMQEETVGLPVSLDVQKDSANMLSALMLAQAQACFFEMASKKKASAGLLAKLAMGTAQLFEKALQMVTVNEGLKSWLSKGTYNYEDHINFQIKCYKAASEYWQSQVVIKSGEEGCYGKEVARLTIASKYLSAAGQLSKKVMPALEDSRKNLAEKLVEPRLEQATKDNQVIYFEVVPNPKDLTPVEGTQNVKINPFTIGKGTEDPFKDLVSKEVQKQAEQMRTNMKAEVKQLTDAANEQTDNAKAMLASLGLPASLESMQVEGGLPDSVWNRIADIQKEGGVQELETIYGRIEAANSEAWKIQEEIGKKLDTEERVFNEIKQKIGQNWQVTPSSQLNGKYREDLKKITEFLTQAVESNSKLEKQIREDVEMFRDLEKNREQLSAELPKPKEQKENPSAEKLKLLLDELSKCIATREELRQQYATQVEDMDIGSMLMAKENGITDEKSQDVDLKAATTGALKEVEGKITETFKTQEKLLESINSANEVFVKSKGTDPTQVLRENMIHSLNQSCEKFNKCKSHLKDGLKFYSDLMADYITTLQTTVEDYVLARESERDMMLADLNTNIAKLGIDAYGNMSSSSKPSESSSSSSLSSLQSQSQGQSPFQSQSQSQQPSNNPSAPSYNPSYNPSAPPVQSQQQWGGYQWQQPPSQYYGPPQQHPYNGYPPYGQQYPSQNYGPPPQHPPYGYQSYYGQQPSNPYYGNPNNNNNNNNQ